MLSILCKYPRERCGTEGFDLEAISHRVISLDLGPLSLDPGTVSYFSDKLWTQVANFSLGISV